MQGPDYMRIGDAERDAMTESLHEHFARGRITAEELDERLSAALSAKTAGELAAIDHDLPKPRPPAPAREEREWPGPRWQGPRHHHHHHRNPHHHRPFVPMFVLVLLGFVLLGGGHGAGPVLPLFAVFWVVLALAAFRRLRYRRDHR